MRAKFFCVGVARPSAPLGCANSKIPARRPLPKAKPRHRHNDEIIEQRRPARERTVDLWRQPAQQAAPQVVPAAEHAEHPFFVNARGRGAGEAAVGRGRGAGRRRHRPGAGPGSTALIVPDEERPQLGVSPCAVSLRSVATPTGRSPRCGPTTTTMPCLAKPKRKRKKRSAGSCRPGMDGNDEDAMAAAAFGGMEEDDEDEDETTKRTNRWPTNPRSTKRDCCPSAARPASGAFAIDPYRYGRSVCARKRRLYDEQPCTRRPLCTTRTKS